MTTSIPSDVSTNVAAMLTRKASGPGDTVRSFFDCLTEQDKAQIQSAFGITVKGDELVGDNVTDSQASLISAMAEERHCESELGFDLSRMASSWTDFIGKVSTTSYANLPDNTAADSDALIRVVNGWQKTA